jgi:hypothetical protein
LLYYSVSIISCSCLNGAIWLRVIFVMLLQCNSFFCMNTLLCVGMPQEQLLVPIAYTTEAASASVGIGNDATSSRSVVLQFRVEPERTRAIGRPASRPTVLSSHNKPTTSQHYFSLKTNQHQPPVIRTSWQSREGPIHSSWYTLCPKIKQTYISHQNLLHYYS